MPMPFRSAACGLVVVAAVASGCGSSKSATTTTTTSSAASPNGATSTATTQSTTSKHAGQTGRAQGPKPVVTTPAVQANGSQGGVATKTKIKPEPKAPPHGKYEYPPQVPDEFIAVCTKDLASKSTCECIVVKYASEKVEEGQSLAELAGVDVTLKDGLPLNARSQKYASECAGH